MSNVELAKILIVVGVVAIVIGLLLATNTRIPFLGKLPGDIRIQKENFSFYFPVTSSIIVSIILSLLFMLFSRK